MVLISVYAVALSSINPYHWNFYIGSFVLAFSHSFFSFNLKTPRLNGEATENVTLNRILLSILIIF